MSDRYKPMGLEMLPTKCYDAWDPENDRPGIAWIYRRPQGIVAIKTDEAKVLTATSKNMREISDYPEGDKFQDFILECAKRDVPIPDALQGIKDTFGEPDIITPISSINDAAPDIKKALNIE